MTVADLIEKLQQLPADLPVYLVDWNEGYAPDLEMSDEDGPAVALPHDIRSGGIVVRQLPKRVIIGGR